MAKKKTKLFPSQIRYLEKNPIISFRLKKEEKEKLEEIVKNTNSPVSKWVSDFVRGKVENEEEKLELLEENKVLEKANEILRTKIENVIRFKVPCSVCGKDMILGPSDENWDSVIYPRLKNAFKDGCHGPCANKS
ncbi:Uncharacterised protein [uncultured archaeon]|nr:Uncharacterised protein [uncultured archaeon]